MLKEEYCAPEIEIVSFNDEDIIKTSETRLPTQPVPIASGFTPY